MAALFGTYQIAANGVAQTVWSMASLVCVTMGLVLMNLYPLEEETKRLTVLLVLIHNIFNAAAFPFADPLGKGLRAAGDIRFTTIV